MDEHRVQFASGEIRFRYDVTSLKIQRVEEFVKLLLKRSLTRPRMVKTTEYADMHAIDRGSVLRFCRSTLGAFYGAASLGRMRASWRLPEDIPLHIVMAGSLAVMEQGVPAKDLIMAALLSGHSSRGQTTAELCKRLKINKSAAYMAIRELKKEGRVVQAGRGKVRVVNEQA